MSKERIPKPRRGRPATGQTPKRYFRMDDDDWESVERAAAAKGQSVSLFIREALLKSAKARTIKSGDAGN